MGFAFTIPLILEAFLLNQFFINAWFINLGPACNRMHCGRYYYVI